MNDETKFYPQLRGIAPDQVDLAIRIAFDYIYQLQEQQSKTQQSVAPLIAPPSSNAGVTISGVSGTLSTSSAILSGPFETRPAVVAAGTVWVETSRGGIASSSPFPTYIFRSGNWVLLWGGFVRTQAQLAALSATLGLIDTGATVYISSPYCHVLKWTGSAWTWNDPADSSGRISHFAIAPGDGWHLMDGATVSRLNADGTLTAGIVLADSTGANVLFLKSGTYTGTRVAAVTPTMDAVSAGTPAGTIAWPAGVPTFTGSALGTHAHELPFAIDIGEAPPDIDVIDQSIFGTGTTRSTVYHAGGVASAESLAVALSQAVSAGTPAGTIAWPAGVPTFTGSALGTHVHTVTLAGGDPVAYLAVPLYYRL